MATAEQIEDLIKRQFDLDAEMFRSIAVQVAAHEAKSGCPKVAYEIKRLADSSRRQLKWSLLSGSAARCKLPDADQRKTSIRVTNGAT